MDKGVERSDERGAQKYCVLLWFGHVKTMENNKIAKRVYVGECTGIRSLSRWGIE